MNIAVECIARGAGDQWEAVCLDFDLAVQGRSLDEVTRVLREMIVSYIDDACAQPEPVRTQMLCRRTPFSVRLSWAARMFFATLCGRRLDKRDRNKREATIGFPVECRA